MQKKDVKRNNEGVTLVALSVTIIILLILAGITIGGLTGENGIIKNANQAKEQSEIAEEKKIIDQAIIQSMRKDRFGNLTQDNLQNALDKIVGEGKIEVADMQEQFAVLFIEKDRYYTIDNDGNIGESSTIVVDKAPGDITKDIEGNELDGSEEHPYEIWCIEDLCDLSNRTNSSTDFRNKYIKLKTTINFKSRFSYVNGHIETEGEIASCNSIEELMKSMQENQGFMPIGRGDNRIFNGVFDGNNNEILNIYINRNDIDATGLFGYFASSSISEWKSIIKDLKVTGNIYGKTAGGIVGKTVGNEANTEEGAQIINCVNNANIKADGYAGGILGEKRSSGATIIIDKCINGGDITSPGAGGIIGDAYTNVIIKDSFNTGKVQEIEEIEELSCNCAGGIVALANNNVKVLNCYNTGEILGITAGGGIAGELWWTEKHFVNCYNSGKVQGAIAGGIIGKLNTSNDLLITKNCYYNNERISKGIGGWTEEKQEVEDIQGYNEGQLKSQELVNVFNEFLDTTTDYDTTELYRWKFTNNEYPTFLQETE